MAALLGLMASLAPLAGFSRRRCSPTMRVIPTRDPPDQASLREEESDQGKGEGEGVSAEESMEGTDEQSVLDPAASEG